MIFEREDDECPICHEVGHSRYDCPVRAREWLNDHGIVTADLSDPAVFHLQETLTEGENNE